MSAPHDSAQSTGAASESQPSKHSGSRRDGYGQEELLVKPLVTKRRSLSPDPMPPKASKRKKAAGKASEVACDDERKTGPWSVEEEGLL